MVENELIKVLLKYKLKTVAIECLQEPIKILLYLLPKACEASSMIKKLNFQRKNYN